MTGGISAMTVMAAAAVAGTAYSAYAGNKARKDQAGAQGRAMEAAKKQNDLAEQQMNKAMTKTPNVAGLKSANEQAARGGIGGTMLTGAQGAAPDAGLLGKSTLLGG